MPLFRAAPWRAINQIHFFTRQRILPWPGDEWEVPHILVWIHESVETSTDEQISLFKPQKCAAQSFKIIFQNKYRKRSNYREKIKWRESVEVLVFR